MTSLTRLRRRSRAEWIAAVVVLGGLAVFVVLVYAVVVLGGGLLLGQTSSNVALSVVATAIVALAFDVVHSRLEAFASRAAHGGQASPYDVLRRFSGTVTGRYAAEELPGRMARLLNAGTGAQWSQVWLVVGGRPTLAATWPVDAAIPDTDDPRAHDAVGRRSLEVRHGSDVLGVLVVQGHPQVPLSSVEERLFSGLAGQAGPVLRGASLRAELEQQAVLLALRADELRESRRRLVDAQDAERRLLERDIHDGAQQHLVALAVNLRLAQTLAGNSPQRAEAVLVTQERAAADAIETLRQLSRGIYPTVLTDHGLFVALEAAAATSPVPVQVTAAGVARYSGQLEAAAYFCSLEALQNAAKHAGASSICVDLRQEGSHLVVTIEDDGMGFDTRKQASGTGLANMRDRVESLSGAVWVESTPGGTRVRATLPITAGA
ncbi:MAG: histidine kinase [Nocardioides sp.]|nr:histidine kinase [Nocardioides sp.]